MKVVYSKKSRRHHYAVKKAEFNAIHEIFAPSEYTIYADGEYVKTYYTKQDAIDAVKDLIDDE